MNKNKSPFFANIIAKIIFPKKDNFYLSGDFKEIYFHILETEGRFAAWCWYWWQVLSSIPHFFSDSILWRLSMFKNYLKIALRNIQKQKFYFGFNILGLSLGLAFFMFAILYVDVSYHFDAFHKNSDRIYAIVQVDKSANHGEEHSAFTPGVLLQALIHEFPEIEKGTHFFQLGRAIVKSNEKVFYENGIIFCDPDFLSMFSYPMAIGDPGTVLLEPNSIVVTESTALKYFGDENPIGKLMTLNNDQTFIVRGVLEDITLNSSHRFDFLASSNSIQGSWVTDWEVYNHATFIRLPKGYSKSNLDEKLSTVINKYYPKSNEAPEQLYLFPLLDFHLKSSHISSPFWWDTTTQLYLAIIIALLFLIVVCFNFMSLTAARHLNRIQEVGMRKVLGAKRSQLIKQFLGESFIITVLAIPLAVFLFEIFVPQIQVYMGNQQELSLWASPWPFVYMIGVTLFAGLVSGSYPAFFVSRFRPIQIFRGKLLQGKQGNTFRKLLIISQFSVAIFLIIFAIVVKSQFNFMTHLDLGYNKDNVIVVPLHNEVRSLVAPLKENLLLHPDILSVSAASSYPVAWETESLVHPQGKGQKGWRMKTYGVDYNFLELFQVQMSQGRTFSREFQDKTGFILDETAIRQLQWVNPLGKEITVGDQKGRVIGVVRDCHFRHMIYSMAPTVFYLEPEQLNYLFVKVSSETGQSQVSEYVNTLWSRLAPDYPFEFFLLQHRFEEKYADNERVSYIFGGVGGLTILITCVGLLGLVSFTIRRKTKEIGIRKVLGASVTGIASKLLSNFLVLVLVANLIGGPLAYLGLKKLLEVGFAYQTSLQFNIFLSTAIITFIITVLAVLSQTIKAALTNPVDSLKYE